MDIAKETNAALSAAYKSAVGDAFKIFRNNLVEAGDDADKKAAAEKMFKSAVKVNQSAYKKALKLAKP